MLNVSSNSKDIFNKQNAKRLFMCCLHVFQSLCFRRNKVTTRPVFDILIHPYVRQPFQIWLSVLFFYDTHSYKTGLH